MDGQKPQYQTFQVLWSSNAHNDRLPPLQMRSFTSDSYRALKEREQKKRQQKKAVSMKWNKAQCGDVPGDFAWLGTALEIPCGSEWNDGICISESTNSRKLSAVREDSQVQPDEPLRRLCPLSNSSGTLVGIESVAVTRCLPVDISNTMSTGAPEPASSEVVPSKELDCGIIQEADVGRSAIPASELDIIIPDDADASIEQPGNMCLDEVDFVCQASCLKPLRSNSSEPCEQQTQGDHTAPANPVCLELNPEHMLAAAMSIQRNESIPAEAFPVTQSHIHCNGDSVKSHASPVGLGRKEQNFNSALQTSWTKDLDERLLHLRHVAQLDWCRVVKYFPEATLSDVKRRYREITQAGTTCDTVRTQHRPRVRGQEIPARSSSNEIAPEKRQCAVSHERITAVKANGKNAPPVRRNATKQYNIRRVMTDPAVTACDGAFERTSRCGRTIRHPFRHRPTEGYI